MTMQPSGKPERVFHTGRNTWVIVSMILGGLFVAAPVIVFAVRVVIEVGPEAAATALGIGPMFLTVVLIGGLILVGSLLLMFRQAIAVYTEGVLVSSWRGRQTFVPWTDLEGIILGEYARTPLNDFAVGWLPLYLVSRRADGETQRFKASCFGSKVSYRKIAAALAERADLEYVAENQHGLDPGETAWRKRSAPGEGPRKIAATERAPSATIGAPFPPAVPGPAPIRQDVGTFGAAAPHGRPERIFPTARNTSTELMIYVPLLAAMLGFALGWLMRGSELTAIDGIARVNVATLIGYYAALVGGIVGFGALLAYVRSALVVYWDGLFLRRWNGRGSFVPWSDLEGIMAQYTEAPNEGVTLYLVLRRADGATQRILLSSASAWGPVYEGITSTLAERADLEYLGRNEGQEVWRRRPDSAAS